MQVDDRQIAYFNIITSDGEQLRVIGSGLSVLGNYILIVDQTGGPVELFLSPKRCSAIYEQSGNA